MFKIRNTLSNYSHLLLTACCFLQLSACNTIDLYERVVAIPAHQWAGSFKPEFRFAIKDTASVYQVFILFRHNNQYRYNNIWVNLSVKNATDTAQQFRLELPLASKEGWMGSGMDDVFDHRIAVTLDPQRFNFSRSGIYTFSLEQIMRDDPLENVMNAGIRIEKKTQ